MIKHILLLAAVVGLIAQSSAFAAEPSPSPSASPAKTHHHKTHHKKSTTAPAAAPSPSATPSQGLRFSTARLLRRSNRENLRAIRSFGDDSSRTGMPEVKLI